MFTDNILKQKIDSMAIALTFAIICLLSLLLRLTFPIPNLFLMSNLDR